MANKGRGGGGPQTGKSASGTAGHHGGNREGQHKTQPDPNGPGNPRQSAGKDPHRGQPG